MEIAKRHLVAKQMKQHGIKKREWSISDGALRGIVRYYTREAGDANHLHAVQQRAGNIERIGGAWPQ